jgi:hypothetical protein
MNARVFDPVRWCQLAPSRRWFDGGGAKRGWFAGGGVLQDGSFTLGEGRGG